MSTNLPTTRLGSVLAAAKKLPTTTGATARGAERRASRALAILADVSGSMAEPCGARRKIDVLREALDLVVGDFRGTLIAFSNFPREVLVTGLPDPGGGTALHLAIGKAAKIGARRLLAISDGRPDDEVSALRAADSYGGPIDVIYCGDDADKVGIEFMARLARRSGGRVVQRGFEAGAQALAADVRRLALTAPR